MTFNPSAVKTMASVYGSALPDFTQAASVHEEAYFLGEAEFLLETLSDFGRVPSGIREQILAQKNDAQLRRWFRLARQVRSLEEFINRM